MDTILKEHLNNETVLKGTSNTVQNEIVDSTLEVCRQAIKDQIYKTGFLAIQCDETIGISNQCQMVVS